MLSQDSKEFYKQKISATRGLVHTSFVNKKGIRQIERVD